VKHGTNLLTYSCNASRGPSALAELLVAIIILYWC